MVAQLIDGKVLAEEVLADISKAVESARIKPGISTVIVGNDPASYKYVEIKGKAAARIGINFTKKSFPATFSPERVIEYIEQQNADLNVHGILLQLPLPSNFNRYQILKHIHPFKDVDALHPKNLGLLLEGTPQFYSPVIQAVNRVLTSTNKYSPKVINTPYDEISTVDLTGVNIVIIGSGLLVGKPLSLFFMQQGATVTVVNEFTADKTGFTKNADIVITGTNQKDILQPDEVRDGSIVIDVGGDLVGEKFFDRDIILSKTPGGVGPLTVSYLMKNVLLAANHNTTMRH